MSDPGLPKSGAVFHGFATVRAVGPVGMITLRAKPDVPRLAEAFAALGLTVPDVRRIVLGQGVAVAWMSPDEYLLILDPAATGATMATLGSTLQGSHHLAVDVSDARAMFRVEGPLADQVLRKLSPADFDMLQPLEVRRTRAAQVAAAFWAQNGGFTIICFRSVADYMMALLSQSAQPGSEL